LNLLKGFFVKRSADQETEHDETEQLNGLASQRCYPRSRMAHLRGQALENDAPKNVCDACIR
jgi:hypothetical protein